MNKKIMVLTALIFGLFTSNIDAYKFSLANKDFKKHYVWASYMGPETLDAIIGSSIAGGVPGLFGLVCLKRQIKGDKKNRIKNTNLFGGGIKKPNGWSKKLAYQGAHLKWMNPLSSKKFGPSSGNADAGCCLNYIFLLEQDGDKYKVIDRIAKTRCKDRFFLIKNNKIVERSKNQYQWAKRAIQDRIKNRNDTWISLKTGNNKVDFYRIRHFIFKNWIDINQKDSNGSSILLVAAARGYHKIVDLLINPSNYPVPGKVIKGANINLQNKEGITPLYTAAARGKELIVKQLLKAGAKKDIKAKNGKTAANVAKTQAIKDLLQNPALIKNFTYNPTANEAWRYSTLKGDYTSYNKMRDIILKKQVNINIQGSDGATALLIAAARGYTQIVDLLLYPNKYFTTNNNLKAADINLQMKSGTTPLYEAASRGHELVVKQLLKAGAKKDIKAKNGKTAMDVAKTQSIKKLLQNPDLIKTFVYKTQYFSDHKNSWWKSVLKGDPASYDKMRNLLSKKQVGINMQGSDGATALLIAAARGYSKIVDLLLYPNKHLTKNSNLKAADINLQMKSGTTPLYEAASRGRELAVKQLLKAGAKKDIKAKNGKTAADVAKTQVIKDLLKNADKTKDFEYKVQGKANYKDLWWKAATKGDSTSYDTMRDIILKKQVDINIKGPNESTALLIAAEKGYEKIVDLLLYPNKHFTTNNRLKAANINAQNKYGRTPLHQAAATGRKKIVTKLIKAGAKKDIKDKQGKNPRDVGKNLTIKNLIYPYSF